MSGISECSTSTSRCLATTDSVRVRLKLLMLLFLAEM